LSDGEYQKLKIIEPYLDKQLLENNLWSGLKNSHLKLPKVK
jgi:hypothetical protein